MAFKYSCFISYRRIDGELANVFITSLESALRSSFAPFAPNTEVFLDHNQMRGPALLGPTLAQRMCESVFMVMVFVPAYFDEEHLWCAREYQAMVELEKKRLAPLPPGANARKHGLIVPVVFRGAAALPAEIRESRKFFDFSKFSLAGGKTNISRHLEYGRMIEAIAETFFEVWLDFQSLAKTGNDPCRDCDGFALPDENAGRLIVQQFQGTAPSAPVKHEAPRNG